VRERLHAVVSRQLTFVDRGSEHDARALWGLVWLHGYLPRGGCPVGCGFITPTTTAEARNPAPATKHKECNVTFLRYRNPDEGSSLRIKPSIHSEARNVWGPSTRLNWKSPNNSSYFEPSIPSLPSLMDSDHQNRRIDILAYARRRVMETVGRRDLLSCPCRVMLQGKGDVWRI
jgi:hypothetical protein